MTEPAQTNRWLVLVIVCVAQFMVVLEVLSTLATSRTNHVVNGFGHVATIVEKTSAQVDGYKLAFTAGAFLMLASGVVVLGLIRRRDVTTIDSEEAITAPVV
jgi:hypothetical protein